MPRSNPKTLSRKIAEGETHPPELPSPVGLKINNEHLLNVVLKHTSLTGAFYDTKFYAFSRRKPDSLVFAPRAVYANSWLLRARVPAYFEQLLSNTYGDCILGVLADGFPRSRTPYNTDYDYGEDSDLEDDSEDEDASILPSHDSKTKDVRERVGEPEKSAVSTKTMKTDIAEPRSTNDAKESNIQEPVHNSTNTNTEDLLWNALIFYLCTGEIYFKPLRSQELPTEKSPWPQATEPPACSPKSMYRLADMLGLDELKAKAKEDILRKVTSDNILDELLSSFTSS
ncbi:hypothetical protein EIP86_008223 [Pleurotus ostreatoroseus]|nr:hypothetical protein EIP86_008223 [Pleurotus ostreatoroseus]